MTIPGVEFARGSVSLRGVNRRRRIDSEFSDNVWRHDHLEVTDRIRAAQGNVGTIPRAAYAAL